MNPEVISIAELSPNFLWKKELKKAPQTVVSLSQTLSARRRGSGELPCSCPCPKKGGGGGGGGGYLSGCQPQC